MEPGGSGKGLECRLLEPRNVVHPGPNSRCSPSSLQDLIAQREDLGQQTDTRDGNWAQSKAGGRANVPAAADRAVTLEPAATGRLLVGALHCARLERCLEKKNFNDMSLAERPG